MNDTMEDLIRKCLDGDYSYTDDIRTYDRDTLVELAIALVDHASESYCE